VSSEKYLTSLEATESNLFLPLGLTDSLILKLAKECSFLITADSDLSLYANALGIRVYDLVEFRNYRLKN